MPHALGQRLQMVLALLALSAEPAVAAAVHSVGSVTWHPKGFIGRTVEMRAYVLAVEDGVILLSDEPNGPVSAHDLPVSGVGADQLVLGRRYVVTGTFVKDARPAPTGSSYHLELSVPPRPLVK